MSVKRTLAFHSVLLGVVALVGVMLPTLSNAFGHRTVVLLGIALALTGLAVLLPDASIPIAVSTVMFFALLRRILPTETPAADVAAILPFLVAAPLAVRGLRHRPPLSVTIFLAWGLATMVMNPGSPLVGAAGIANLGVPMMIGLGAAALPGGLQRLTASFVITGGLAATYGVFQYFSPLSWDVRWLADSNFFSAGRIGTSEFRPFATLPSPGTMALVAAVVVLLVVLPRSPVRGTVRVWAGTSCGLLLLLTQVRSVWIATVAALLVAAIGDRRSAGRMIATVAVLSLAVLPIVPSRTTLVERVKSLSNPTADTSYSSRANLLRSSAALASPFGRGLGQYSAGNRLEGGSALDNGYLVVLAETGIIGIALLGWVLIAVARGAKPPDYPFLVFLLIVNAAGFAIGGVGAILLWATCGLQRMGRPTGRENGVKLSTPRREWRRYPSEPGTAATAIQSPGGLLGPRTEPGAVRVSPTSGS